MYENNTGGIIRLWPMPSISMQWQIGWTYQMKVPVKASLDETWAPFPDELPMGLQQRLLGDGIQARQRPALQ